MESATKSDVGKYGYPHDNSWSKEISTGHQAYLAGCGGVPPKPRRLVRIVSTPFWGAVKILGKIEKREFVHVQYDDRIYRVLNKFYEINEQDERLDAIGH